MSKKIGEQEGTEEKSEISAKERNVRRAGKERREREILDERRHRIKIIQV